MKVKCEYCGAMIDDQLEHCPNCGAPNKNIRRTVDHTPKTIEELQQWYKDRNLPPYETTRFFIGENYTGKRAFGIYRDGDEVIVYKNKDDGTRTIRYQGTDEAYGVNELYLKLKSEILNQKARNGGGGNSRKKNAGDGCLGILLSMVGIVVFGVFSVIIMTKPLLTILAIGLPILLYMLLEKLFPSLGEGRSFKVLGIAYLIYLMIAFIGLTGLAIQSYTPTYYNYDDNVYVYYDSDYYYYDSDSDDYTPVERDSLPAEFTENRADYEFDYDDSSWDSSYSFKDSDYYNDNLASDDYSSDGDYDSDYDWDSGSSWDSGGDWGSDW